MLRELADEPAIKEELPLLQLMTAQLENAAPRPVTPDHNDVSLAVRQVLHPMRDIEPQQTYQQLRNLVAPRAHLAGSPVAEPGVADVSRAAAEVHRS